MWHKPLREGDLMKAMFLIFLLGSAVALAQSTAPTSKSTPSPTASKVDPHQAEDIARHRQMAKAHEEAARCLESGVNEAQCHSQLRAACKGIAVGQYCGMRHAH
jgi:hypothetical protein